MKRRGWVGLGALLALSCGPGEPAETPAPGLGTASAEGDWKGIQRHFGFETIDGRVVTTAGYRGRMTVIVFVATYDTASQAQARFVNDVYLRHKPRINALMLALEPAANAPLVEAFAAHLELRYDVALADEATVAGEGPFPGLHHVPALVLLDREGREAWRSLGVTEFSALEDALRAHEGR
jgi:hypothetical protein